MRSFVLLLFVVCFLGLSTAKLSAQAAASDTTRTYPPIKLRAYGTLSAEEQADGRSSSFVITAENEEKAKLVLAKYLSDLAELPGVSPLSVTTARGPVLAHLIEKQGALAALRQGSHVVILTAPDPTLLLKAIKASNPQDTKIDSSTAEIEVPMYLDRWDKYGFRFYYGPFTKPRDGQGRDIPGNYDPRRISSLPTSRANRGSWSGIPRSTRQAPTASSIWFRGNGSIRPLKHASFRSGSTSALPTAMSY